MIKTETNHDAKGDEKEVEAVALRFAGAVEVVPVLNQPILRDLQVRVHVVALPVHHALDRVELARFVCEILDLLVRIFRGG